MKINAKIIFISLPIKPNRLFDRQRIYKIHDLYFWEKTNQYLPANEIIFQSAIDFLNLNPAHLRKSRTTQKKATEFSAYT